MVDITGLVQKSAADDQTARIRVTIKGVVQGVGFRPFVYHLASLFHIRGTVLNSGKGVVIDAEGEQAGLLGFLEELFHRPPALARITEIQCESLAPCGYSSFKILMSEEDAGRTAMVPPDVALCADCRREVLDPADRHYGYPFTNCTNCGPRFTILQDLPYDREQTAMAGFPMCAGCAREYHYPADRRFHAQPVACPQCGPRVELTDCQGRTLAGNWQQNFFRLIQDGAIIAVKSLGGFHLACDAKNARAIATLRNRKHRPAKPLAVMARDLEVLSRYCQISGAEAGALASPQAPIVVLCRRQDHPLPEGLAPGLSTLGAMLPYTPLHLLLFSGPLELMVMTSGNRSEMPIAKDNHQALVELGGLADYFLWHNRDILQRCDDSLAAVAGGELRLYRRSRGYVPGSIPVPAPKDEVVVLGTGGDLKNTFCLLKAGQAVFSQHIGDLNAVEGEEHFCQSLEHLGHLLGTKISVVAHDLHPGYHASRIGRRIPALYHTGIQHHHAHLAAGLAENGLTGPAIGAILDGTGYGTDGAVWGCEFLVGDYLDFQRAAHLAYLPLPGGDAAVQQPWMMAVSYLLTYLGGEGADLAARLFPAYGAKIPAVTAMVQKGFNSPPVSSAGRLFDAAAAILGICLVNTYEGQSAVELSDLAAREEVSPANFSLFPSYPFRIEHGVIWPEEMVSSMVAEVEQGVDRKHLAMRFHHTVAAMVLSGVQSAAALSGLKRVVLSGGVWQNCYLLTVAQQMLKREGFEVYTHREVPCNDGGLALGQAMIGYWRWRKDVPRDSGTGGHD